MNRRRWLQGSLAACAMLVIILDAKTAASAAQDGIELCIRTVIPSLFPFFILSGLINSCLLGQKISILRPLGKLCKIPKGAESLMLLGYISGYPVGAQLTAQAYREGKLSKETARRMLGFCNNAGPAFLFGMLSPLSDSIGVIWVLWGIHILSGLLVGCVLPGNRKIHCNIKSKQHITIVQSMQNAIRVIASVCGWVIVFRIIINFCDRWFLWMLPQEVQVLFSGLLELSNGCIQLQRINNAGMQFIIAAVMLSFGGVCVGMQTLSVTEDLGTGWYFPGKVLQTVFSLILSGWAQLFLFSNENRAEISLINLFLLAAIAAWGIYLSVQKKVVAFRKKLLYNNIN